MENIEIICSESGIRIDKYINISNISRAMLQTMIENGNVTVNGKACKSNYKVKQDDVISIVIDDPKEADIVAENIQQAYQIRQKQGEHRAEQRCNGEWDLILRCRQYLAIKKLGLYDLLYLVVIGRAGVAVNETVNDSTLEKMLLNDLLYVISANAAVEGSVGINNNDGTECAKTEAARHSYLNLISNALFCKALLEDVYKLRASGGGTTCTAADKHLSFVFAACKISAREHIDLRGVLVFDLVKSLYSFNFHLHNSFRLSPCILPEWSQRQPWSDVRKPHR